MIFLKKITAFHKFTSDIINDILKTYLHGNKEKITNNFGVGLKPVSFNLKHTVVQLPRVSEYR